MRAIVDKCYSYEKDDLQVNICFRHGRPLVITIASRNFAYHLINHVESLWISYGDGHAREVYVDHKAGKIEVVDYDIDEDFTVLREKKTRRFNTRSREGRKILREFEEIANLLLDRAATVLATRNEDVSDDI